MVVVPKPRHVDDLEAFYRQHRLLGVGILVGGLVGLAASMVLLLTLDVPLPVVLLLGSVWLLPVLFGLLWRGVGADLMQRRSAARMVEAPETA